VNRTRFAALAALALGAWAALAAPAARAASLALVGTFNPVGGPGSATKSYFLTSYTESLNPNPGNIYAGHPVPWVSSALSAQGFDAAHGWTINYVDLGGTYTVGTYYAWVESRPAITQGGENVGAQNSPGSGGAAFGVSYAPSAGEAGIQFHWLSVALDNEPLPGTVGVASGSSTIYVDDSSGQPGGWTAGQMPWYDIIGAANSRDFIDAPSNPYDGKWQIEFHTMVAWSPAANTIDVGATFLDWGVKEPKDVRPNAAPEPSGVVLLGLGAACLLGVRRRRAAA
jgi:hypothetical protein